MRRHTMDKNNGGDTGGLRVSNISNSKKAKRAITAMDSFFTRHDFSEDEKNLFYIAAMGAAAAALDGEEPPMHELTQIAYICQHRDVDAAEVGKHIEGFIHVLKAMSAEWEEEGVCA